MLVISGHLNRRIRSEALFLLSFRSSAPSHQIGFGAGRGDDGSNDGTQFHIKAFDFRPLFIEELGWDTLREVP